MTLFIILSFWSLAVYSAALQSAARPPYKGPANRRFGLSDLSSVTSRDQPPANQPACSYWIIAPASVHLSMTELPLWCAAVYGSPAASLIPGQTYSISSLGSEEIQSISGTLADDAVATARLFCIARGAKVILEVSDHSVIDAPSLLSYISGFPRYPAKVVVPGNIFSFNAPELKLPPHPPQFKVGFVYILDERLPVDYVCPNWTPVAVNARAVLQPIVTFWRGPALKTRMEEWKKKLWLDLISQRILAFLDRATLVSGRGTVRAFESESTTSLSVPSALQRPSSPTHDRILLPMDDSTLRLVDFRKSFSAVGCPGPEGIPLGRQIFKGEPILGYVQLCLYIRLYDAGFIDSEDVDRIYFWTESLIGLGYGFPAMQVEED